MREPRYRFPEIVRSTTRTMASRMVADGRIAETPEALEGWIEEEPAARDALRKGGYGKEFTAHDLFPLFQVMVGKAGGPTPGVEMVPPAARPAWMLGAAIVAGVVIVLLIVGLATGAFSGP